MATLKEFPKALYKGNSVNMNLTIKDKLTGGYYEFKVGDKVRIGIKGDLEDDEYQVYKEFNITEEGTIISLKLSPEDTDSLTETETKGILEIELVYNEGKSIKTVYQDSISLEGVVINE